MKESKHEENFLTTIDRCYCWHFVFWENHPLIAICFNICIDWSSLGKAILENSNDQGLITFKVEIKRYLSNAQLCVGHSAQNIS